MIKYLFYPLVGTAVALLAWTVFALFSLIITGIFSLETLPFRLEWLLLPFVATFLTIGMVLTETFLSNPTRIKTSWRNFKRQIKGTLQWGLGIGFAAALITEICHRIPSIPGLWIRIVSWTLIGLVVGFNQGLSWKSHSIENNTDKAKLRTFLPMILCSVAGFFSAVLIENLRKTQEFGNYEDAFGFAILGLCLGFFLNFASVRNYQYALRLGKGFELFGIENKDNKEDNTPGKIQNSLKFVVSPKNTSYFLEEGLSIELPSSFFPLISPKKNCISIGSDPEADILIKKLPPHCAELKYHFGEWKICCSSDDIIIKVQGSDLRNEEKRTLKHNYLVTLENDSRKNPDQPFLYHFVFYNRVLDPQA